MSKEQEGLIELVGQEYTKWFYDNAAPSVSGKPILNGEGILTRGEFINKCKTDTEFSERWGLKIEERTTLEQVDQTNPVLKGSTTLYPRKLITITYNNEIIKMYE
jgi:hypothetical protein